MGGCLSTRRARRSEGQLTKQIAEISLEPLSPEYSVFPEYSVHVSPEYSMSPEYSAFKQCYDALVTAMRGQVGDVSTALFSKGLISKEALDYVTTDGIVDSKKARKLVESVSDCIKVTPSRFHDFIAILDSEGLFNEDIVRKLRESFQGTQKVEQLEPNQPVAQGNYQPLLDPLDQSSLANEAEPTEDVKVKPATRTVFVCPYCKECSPQEFFSKEGCPKKVPSIEIKTLFPYLDVTGFNNDIIIDLEEKLISDTTDIMIKFREFSLSSRESLEEKNIPLDRIQDCVLSAVVICKNQRVNALDTDHKKEIHAAKSIASVFSILRVYSYITFLNYQIIELLVHRYGSAADKQKLDEYLDDFKIFCQRNVFEVPQSAFSSNKSRKTAKVFSIKCTKSTLSLEGVLVLQEEVAKIFDIESSALQLCSVKKGCVELGFVVSAAIFDLVFPLSSFQQSALCNLGVRLLSLEEPTLNQKKNMEGTSRMNPVIFRADLMPTSKMPPPPMPPPRMPLRVPEFCSQPTKSMCPVIKSSHFSSRDRYRLQTKYQAVDEDLPLPLNERPDSGYLTANTSPVVYFRES